MRGAKGSLVRCFDTRNFRCKIKAVPFPARNVGFSPVKLDPAKCVQDERRTIKFDPIGGLGQANGLRQFEAVCGQSAESELAR